MDFVMSAFQTAQLFWQNYAIVGAIMVSAVIVFIGMLKPFIFNRIKWKPLRKATLATANILFSFVAVAVYFWAFGKNWDFYWGASAMTSVGSVLTYFLYESYGLRDAIHKIGNLVIDKAAKIAKLWLNNSTHNVIEEEIKNAATEIKSVATKELKSARKKSKNDKELENL